MSIYNELLHKFNELSKAYSQKFEINIKESLDVLDKFGDDYKKERGRTRETQRPKPALQRLQSIHEDEASDDNNKPKRKSSIPKSSTPPVPLEPAKRPSKRSKNEVDGMISPEQDKRLKRNASIRAQNNITKQVNVTLNQKMRREDTADDTKRESRSRRRGRKEDKENDEPLIPPVNIKKEKISLPEETSEPLIPDVEVKKEKDVAVMPPPSAPVSRSRRVKDKAEEVKREMRNENMPPPEVPPSRPTRASSRANSTTASTSSTDASLQAEARPKRTRAKKKQPDPEPETEKSQDSAQSSPAEKSRPKRTRRGAKKAVDDQPLPKPEDNTNKSPEKTPVKTTEPLPKNKLPQNVEAQSPILPSKMEKSRNTQMDDGGRKVDEGGRKMDEGGRKMDETMTVANKMDETMTLANKMNETVTLHNGVGDGVESPRKAAMNETVVLETNSRKTKSMDTASNKRMDETVVLSKGTPNITNDDSLISEDLSDARPPTPQTPPKHDVQKPEPTSAVKVKVQQFEELASRITRTKTRAMAKKEENENHTPPDNVIPKAGISADTLKKMNNLIFNGKVPQVSSSACKPRAPPVKQPTAPSTASKATALARQKEAAEESLKREKECARKKKEAMLDAKREMQKRKREEKMAAAAAAREAAEKERLAMIEAAQKERQEKMAHAEQEKVERMKEAERKKQEAARKAAEIEERRRAEEVARQQRLADEQKRADNRKKQQEEAEAMKKEAAIMAKEMEKRQKEYIERQKMKERQASRGHNTPLKMPGTPSAAYGPPVEPVYMKDGFQYLNSDSDSDETKPKMPVPAWSTSKARKHPLRNQYLISAAHVDRLFSVRTHSPDLREIFPNIERRALKRTSSAVWRTPPGKLPVLAE